MNFYFNMADTDRNGVITVPEFIKLVIDICGEDKEEDGDVVQVQSNFFLQRIVFRVLNNLF